MEHVPQHIAAARLLTEMRRRRHVSAEQLAKHVTYVSKTGQRYNWVMLIEAMEREETTASWSRLILWLAVVQALDRVRPVTYMERVVWRREVCGIGATQPQTKD